MGWGWGWEEDGGVWAGSPVLANPPPAEWNHRGQGGVQAESGPNEIAEGGLSPGGGLGGAGGLCAQLNPAAEWRNRFYRGGEGLLSIVTPVIK